MFEKLKKSFLESNRWKHFIYAIPIGLVFSILCVLGVSSGMEYKDYAFIKPNGIGLIGHILC